MRLNKAECISSANPFSFELGTANVLCVDDRKCCQISAIGKVCHTKTRQYVSMSERIRNARLWGLFSAWVAVYQKYPATPQVQEKKHVSTTLLCNVKGFCSSPINFCPHWQTQKTQMAPSDSSDLST